MIFEYEVDGRVAKDDEVELGFVVEYLHQMDPVHNSFCILTDSGSGSYVQCAGSKDRMTVEFRKYEMEQFHHYVIGLKASTPVNAKVKYSDGNISIKSNEALIEEQAKEIFIRFFTESDIPSEYVLRETTDMFL